MNTQIPNRLRFPYKKFLWDGHKSQVIKNGKRIITVDGPLCSECKVKLTIGFLDDNAECIICKKVFEYSSRLKDEALRYLEAKYEEDVPILSFDLTPTNIITEDNKDENYWLQAKIIQKNGKKMAIVYLGEKIHGTQNKTDYTQFFVDIDDEQIRFDKGNKNPMKLLFSLKAEFPTSITEVKKK